MINKWKEEKEAGDGLFCHFQMLGIYKKLRLCMQFIQVERRQHKSLDKWRGVEIFVRKNCQIAL